MSRSGKAGITRSKGAGINASPPAGTDTPPPPPRSTEGKKTMQFKYEAATGLHHHQFPDRFRIVITGPLHEQEAVEHALNNLKEQKP